jgi:hypothetical protein
LQFTPKYKESVQRPRNTRACKHGFERKASELGKAWQSWRNASYDIRARSPLLIDRPHDRRETEKVSFHIERQQRKHWITQAPSVQKQKVTNKDKQRLTTLLQSRVKGMQPNIDHLAIYGGVSSKALKKYKGNLYPKIV